MLIALCEEGMLMSNDKSLNSLAIHWHTPIPVTHKEIGPTVCKILQRISDMIVFFHAKIFFKMTP